MARLERSLKLNPGGGNTYGSETPYHPELEGTPHNFLF